VDTGNTFNSEYGMDCLSVKDSDKVLNTHPRIIAVCPENPVLSLTCSFKSAMRRCDGLLSAVFVIIEVAGIFDGTSHSARH
jgi:hypothetical protein